MWHSIGQQPGLSGERKSQEFSEGMSFKYRRNRDALMTLFGYRKVQLTWTEDILAKIFTRKSNEKDLAILPNKQRRRYLLLYFRKVVLISTRAATYIYIYYPAAKLIKEIDGTKTDGTNISDEKLHVRRAQFRRHNL